MRTFFLFKISNIASFWRWVDENQFVLDCDSPLGQYLPECTSILLVTLFFPGGEGLYTTPLFYKGAGLGRSSAPCDWR